MSETKINASQTTITAEDIGASSAFDTMPTAAVGYLNKIVQYVGTTDATYTNGYFYKCVSDGQNPATYSWTAVAVQASSGGLPSQTGNSGKFLTTDGTDASWSDKPIVNNTTASDTYALSNRNISYSGCTILGSGATTDSSYSISIGHRAYGSTNSISLGNFSNCGSTGENNVVIGASAAAVIGNSFLAAAQKECVAIGHEAIACAGYQVAGYGIMQFGKGTNSESGTVCFGLTTDGTNFTNYKLLNSDGTIPADRLASTSGLADGNYRLRLTMSSGVPTLSWVAE